MITSLLLAALLSITYSGGLRDRVSPSENALVPDGFVDGVFTVVHTGDTRTITALQLASGGARWDTVPNNVFWSLGVAAGLDAPLYNAANESVNFAVGNGSTFNLFAADCCGGIFANGRQFTLTATFSDGTTATATATIGAVIPQPIDIGYVTITFTFGGDFTVAFAPGVTYTTKQSTAPDGGSVVEFLILK